MKGKTVNSKELKSIVCPRCLGFIPSNGWPGMYPGAISRKDNVTEICSDCGVEEAVSDWMNPQDVDKNGYFDQAWPIISPSAMDRAVGAIEIALKSEEPK